LALDIAVTAAAFPRLLFLEENATSPRNRLLHDLRKLVEQPGQCAGHHQAGRISLCSRADSDTHKTSAGVGEMEAGLLK
jgi:hypothetical protein